MTLTELLTELSLGEFSNLSLGNDGAGTIKTASIPKIIFYTNEALLNLYSRFVLSSKIVLIESYEEITNYHLIPKYSESQNCVEKPYIKDLAGEPFIDDVIRILAVYDGLNSYEYPLNDSNDPTSLFTPTIQTLQIPFPKEAHPFQIEYQAKHYKLVNDNLDQIIRLPFALHKALRSWIAYKTYSNMNGQENSIKAQEHFANYEAQCNEVVEKDLVNSTYNYSHTKFENRGFV